MNPSFRGFKDPHLVDPKESTNSQTTESNSEPSDYDTTVSSRETSPTKNLTDSSASSRETTPTRNLTASSVSSRETTPSRKRGSNTGKVKRLVERFSDSDTAEASVRSTRRRKSNTLEHTQLPAGGEKELRRKMAAQAQANEAIKLWKALLEHLKTTLDEASQAIDQNMSRGVLMGHSAGLAALEIEVGKAWDKVEPFQENSSISIDKVELLLTKSKYNTWCSRVKGHLAALTEEKSGSISSSQIIQVVNPTRFGDLELPDFFGDYTEFNGFESNFKALIDNGNLDDGGKKAHLLKHIKGDAKEFIGSDGLAAKTYGDI